MLKKQGCLKRYDAAKMYRSTYELTDVGHVKRLLPYNQEKDQLKQDGEKIIYAQLSEFNDQKTSEKRDNKEAEEQYVSIRGSDLRPSSTKLKHGTSEPKGYHEVIEKLAKHIISIYAINVIPPKREAAKSHIVDVHDEGESCTAKIAPMLGAICSLGMGKKILPVSAAITTALLTYVLAGGKIEDFAEKMWNNDVFGEISSYLTSATAGSVGGALAHHSPKIAKGIKSGASTCWERFASCAVGFFKLLPEPRGGDGEPRVSELRPSKRPDLTFVENEDPYQVARDSLRGMEKGRTSVRNSWDNYHTDGSEYQNVGKGDGKSEEGGGVPGATPTDTDPLLPHGRKAIF